MTDRALQLTAVRYRSYLTTGAVNNGGKIYFYAAGTTTAKDTYQDAEATTPSANPVVLDTRGEAAIYGRGAYKIVEKTSADVQIGDAQDGILLPEITDVALGLLNDSTTTDMRTTLGLGTAATKDAGTSANEVLLLAENAKLPVLDGSNLTNLAAAAASSPFGYKSGFTLSRNANTTLGITAGACRSSADAANMSQGSAFTKTLASFVAGTGNGSLQIGLNLVVSTDYHVHAINNSSTNANDFLVSTSPGSPSLPSGYDTFRRIGSFKTDTNPYITDFVQFKNQFLWKAVVEDWNAAGDGNLGTAASNKTLTVPTGIQVDALFTATAGTNGVAGSVYFSSPDVDDEAPKEFTTAPFSQLLVPLNTGVRFSSGQLNIRTNTSAQVRVRCSQAAYAVDISTMGWVDLFQP